MKNGNEIRNKTSLDEKYWLMRLAEYTSALDLPIDFSRTSSYQFNGDVTEARVNEELAGKVKEFSQIQGISIPSIYLSAYMIWLYLNSNEEDILIGNAVTIEKDQLPILLPFRLSFASLNSVMELLKAVDKQLAMDIEQHSVLPDVTEILKERDISRPKVYPAIFQMNAEFRSNSAAGERFTYETDLKWNVFQKDQEFMLKIEYNTHVFYASSIQRFIEQYMNILNFFVQQDLSGEFRSMNILSEVEKDIYNRLNNTSSPYEKNMAIPQMFYHSVEKYPNLIAVSSSEGYLTYAELNEKSNQVAHMLIANGLKKGAFAAILMERSMETVISILGILKAGGVYVPIDPTYPKERCKYLLADAEASFILTKRNYSELLNELIADDEIDRNVFFVDHSMDRYSKENIYLDIKPNDLAYVIYTSGSTGKPKGTLLAHEGVINLVASLREVYECTEDDVITQFFSYSFDPSVGETFMSLFSGARLHLLSEMERISIEEFANAVERIKATNIIVPTAFFNQLALHLTEENIHQWKTVKRISMGGEALTGSMVRKWQEKFGTDIEVINLYGPTECTVIATINKLIENVPEEQKNIPIGKPLNNYEAYVLNRGGQLSPLNVPGELCIGGVGLAKGYWKRADKTMEAFVPHPFSSKKEDRLYRTGDIVRLLPNGFIEFVGRKDTQVKVRGFRIEIGEIEDVFARKSNIQEVAVIPKSLADGNKSLIAYYSGKNGMKVDQKDIRVFLEERIPTYMIPDHFIQLDEMPLSPTGKIDRKQLESLEENFVNDEYVEPKTENQRILAAAWEKVLERNQVGIHDDFFHIGGHSLKILQIIVHIKKHFPFIKIQDFYQYRTIAEMDAYISKTKVPLRNKGDKAGVWKVKDLVEPSDMPILASNISSSPPRGVLLTGSTGYLGSHLLYELLHRTDAHIYCLIRQNSDTALMDRLKDTMHFYFGSDILEKMDERITPLSGDLSKKNLDLSQEDVHLILQECDSFIHCGADVRHFGDSTHFDQVNVSGTRTLLELAKLKEGVHFHHISTMGIPEELAFTGKWNENAAKGDFDYDVELENVYTQSKLLAENLVKKVIKEGLSATIYRAGNLSCHSKSGMFQQNMDSNAFYRMIKAMLYLGKAPKANWYVDITPIDYASQAIVGMACYSNVNGKTLHICNPTQITYSSLIQSFQNIGYDIEVMELEEYEDWLVNGKHSEEIQEYLTLAIAQLEGEGAKDSDFRFNCQKTTKLLEDTNIRCADPDKELLKALIHYGIKMNYFPEPQTFVTSSK